MTEPDGVPSSRTYASWSLRSLESTGSDGVVHWTSPNLSHDEPIAVGFADIEVPHLCETLGVLWLWTIVDPGDPFPVDELTIALEKDRAEGWSPERISRGLEDWTAKGLGRTDIRFQWDPKTPSAIIERVRDAERRSEAEPPLQIGEGVAITPHALNQLVELPPDHAQTILSRLEGVAAAGEHHGSMEERDNH
jgi:hypothetical protein